MLGHPRSVEECPNRGKGRGHPLRRHNVEPDQSRVSVQPGFLMTNVAVGVKPNPLDGLLKARLSTKKRQKLAIAEATHGRGALWHSALEQGSQLGDESAVDLVAHPVVHGAIEGVTRHGQADLEGREWWRALALLGRHRDAGPLVDSPRRNGATKVAPTALTRRRIDLAQPLHQD